MIIVSGPSTVGKNPFIYEACKLFKLVFVTPYTTRSIRKNEKEGIDYFFVSKDEFQNRIINKDMFEWDYCLENYYGYGSKFPQGDTYITHGLSRMALRLKSKYPDEVKTIFLKPENTDRIFYNLEQIYNGKELLYRKFLVEEELCHSVLFDYILKCSDSSVNLLKQKDVINLLT